MQSGRWFAVFVLAGLAALAACGSGGEAPKDAAADAPPDVPPACGSDAYFTGAVLDWDSTSADPCGVRGMKLTVRGDANRTSTTAPNGRFEVCIAHQAQTVLDAAAPTVTSECPRIAGASYSAAGVAIAVDAVIAANGLSIPRVMTQARQDAMFTQIGQAYSPAQAQLVVHIAGTARAVSIAAAHATTQAWSGTAWAAGDTGSDVFFPNVAPGSTTVTVAGGATGAGTITLAAGAFTYLTVIAN